MTGTKKKYIGIVSTISFVILTSCGSPVKNEKLTELQDAKAQLERNIAMYDETWNRFFEGETSIVNSERFQEDVVVVTAQGDIVGIEATKNYYLNFLTGFSNQEFTILEVVGQGDRLVKHWNFKGTHDGDFFGVLPTGKKVDVSGTTLVKMKNGKIASEQDYFDLLDFYTQLGLM